MACELQVAASLQDLKLCREYLFGDTTDDNAWLHKCVIAFSPFGDRALLARGSALAVFTSQWDKRSVEKNHANFLITKQWECAEHFAHKDFITCATFLPIAEKRPHSSNGLDWTCIAIGFASGRMAFFTENMDLLIQYQLHHEPLRRIHANSYKKRKSDGNEFPESFYAVFPSVICSFSAFNLFQTLRTTRSEVALRLAKGLNITSEAALDFKKYMFTNNGVRDAYFIGNTITNNFDHLLNSSLRGNYLPSPPQCSVIACTGDNTWLQFLDTSEGVKKIDVTEVALSVLGNIVRRTGFMGLVRGDEKESTEKPVEKLTEQFSLMDRGRDGRSIALSPDATLLAVTDSLGRVTLADVRTGVALRLWKGYRDAECGFIEVCEDVPKHRKKRSSQPESSPKDAPHQITVIVIYAPKKGLIEIFPVRYGPRIAAIQVSKNGRLIYTPYELLGLNSAPRKSSTSYTSVTTFLCEDGLMNINVPFHCACVDATPSAKDYHHLRKLKMWLKEGDHDENEIFEQITSVAKELETNEVRLQTIDFIISVKEISSATLCSALDVCMEFAQVDDVPMGSGHQRDLICYCKQLKKLIKFYDFINQLKLAEGPATESNLQPMTDLLILPDSEVRTLFELLNNVHFVSAPKRENKVTFSDNNGCDLSTLLKCFDVNDSYAIVTNSDITDEEVCLLGDLLFGNILNNMCHLEAWTTEAGLSNICAHTFSRCFLMYWLNRPVKNNEQELRRFIPLYKAITTLFDDVIVASDYNLESSWWTEARNTISHSNKPLAALTAAVCCRAVTIMCEQEAELNKSAKMEKMDKLNQSQPNISLDWENVSADTWQWDLLISHLEDIAILNAVLSVKVPIEDDEDSTDISLREIVSNGESAVSELAARWLYKFHIAPNLLVNKSDVEFQVNIESPETEIRNRKLLKSDEELAFPLIEIAEEVQPGSQSEQIILGHLSMLKKRFPYSLTSSVILSHLFWNCMTKWLWNLANIKLLESAIAHLESIPSVHLQIGMGCLAWSTFLKIHVEKIIRVIAKCGKLPTDTLCTKEFEIPRQQILPLLQCSTQLLGVILDASAQRPLNTFIFRHESIWRDSKAGLVRTAASRALPSTAFVQLHCQVIHLFELLTNFDLKNRTLMPALLDTLKPLLFGELTQQKDIVDTQGLNDQIAQFLCSAITAAVHSESDNVKLDYSKSLSLKWFQFCLVQASDWRVQADVLRRHYVCELYSSGYDRLAELVVDDVQDSQRLASQLLVVVGHRVKDILNTSKSPHKIIASLSPSLTSWLKSLSKSGGTGQCYDENDMEILLHRIFRWLPEDSAETKLAGLLLESIPGIMSLK